MWRRFSRVLAVVIIVLIVASCDAFLNDITEIGEVNIEAQLACNYPSRIAWSSDGRYLACVNEREEVSFWETIDWQPVYSFDVPASGNRVFVAEIAWSPNSCCFAVLTVSSQTIDIWIWEIGNTPRQVAHLQPNRPESSYSRLTWGENESTLAVEQQRLITVFSGVDWTTRYEIPFERVAVIDPALEQVARTNSNFDIEIVNVRSQEVMTTLTGDNQTTRILAWRHDGNQLAAASDGGNVYIWDADTGQSITHLTHPRRVTGISWSPDLNFLAVNIFSDDIRTSDHVYIWNTNNYSLHSVLQTQHDYQILWHFPLWSPTSNYLAASVGLNNQTELACDCSKNQLYIWNAQGVQVIRDDFVLADHLIAWNHTRDVVAVERNNHIQVIRLDH
jgi:WD40 repeat protein